MYSKTLRGERKKGKKMFPVTRTLWNVLTIRVCTHSLSSPCHIKFYSLSLSWRVRVEGERKEKRERERLLPLLTPRAGITLGWHVSQLKEREMHGKWCGESILELESSRNVQWNSYQCYCACIECVRLFLSVCVSMLVSAFCVPFYHQVNFEE